MVKTFFNSLSGDHRIDNHEDWGGYKSKSEAQEAYRHHSFRRGKADASDGRKPDPEDLHKGKYKAGYQEHQRSSWGSGKGNKDGDVR